MLIYKIVWLFLINAVFADEEINAEVPVVADSRPKYSTPTVPENAFFAETFDSKNEFATWTVSTAKKDGVDQEIAKYNGRWEVKAQNENALDGDMGLLLKDKARHHAISKKLIQPFTFENVDQFVLQYEVNFQQGIECGGGYVKLLSQNDELDLDNFGDKSSYTIMFGPDKCGEDYKLHFIFRHKNPKTGEYEEKHAKKTSADLKSPYGDKSSHLYTLVINSDNSFVVYLDQKEINRGNLLEDVSPPVNPPKEVPDKDDRKPEDWDEREKIPDPEATKPDDWDEDAPATIPDPDAEMPEGWLEEEPTYVDDPEAEQPEDWDDEMDGEWEPPKIENSKCTDGPGCGPWEPPMISNPEFKGKWRPEMILNPNYKGIWKPRMIPNPDFFEDLNPFKMTPIAAVGLELWSMSSEIMFDNILITSDKAEADEFAAQTWKLKRIVYNTNEKRKSKNKKVKGKTRQLEKDNEAGIFQGLLDATNERPWLWAIYILVVGLPIILIFTFCCSGKKKEDDNKKTDEPTPDDPHEEEEDDKKEEEDSKSGAEEAEDEKANGDAAPASKADLEEDEEDEAEEVAPEPEEENQSQDEEPRRTSRKRRQRKE